MANIEINITENGTTTLATAGKYCDRNVDVVVDVAGSGGTELPEEALNHTGDLNYLNYNGRWDWFFNQYGSQMTVAPISNTSWMEGSTIEDWKPNYAVGSAGFSGMKHLKTVSGEITGGAYLNLNSLFSNCWKLREIPPKTYTLFENYSRTDYYNLIFNCCFSLRSIPGSIMATLDGTNRSSLFNTCAIMDEIIDLPVGEYVCNYNQFNAAFSNTSRLKRFTFATDNGTPYVANWKTQTLDFSIRVGWVYSDATITSSNYDTQLTTDTRVTDDATYQALKDNPDWWTTNVDYSRYNHDSAVETINSLPDTSAYLATAGGTNTIKFRGDAGTLTDGGAINTLTEAEIAVATAKGWTVTLV